MIFELIRENPEGEEEEERKFCRGEESCAFLNLRHWHMRKEDIY